MSQEIPQKTTKTEDNVYRGDIQPNNVYNAATQPNNGYDATAQPGGTFGGVFNRAAVTARGSNATRNSSPYLTMVMVCLFCLPSETRPFYRRRFCHRRHEVVDEVIAKPHGGVKVVESGKVE